MGTVVKISSKSSSKGTLKALSKFVKKSLKQKKTLADFYGKEPDIFGDGLQYQTLIRSN